MDRFEGYRLTLSEVELKLLQQLSTIDSCLTVDCRAEPLARLKHLGLVQSQTQPAITSITLRGWGVLAELDKGQRRTTKGNNNA